MMNYLKCHSLFTLFFIFWVQFSCNENTDKPYENLPARKKTIQYADYAKLDTLHTKLGEPQPGEWLNYYEESRQSFAEFVSKIHIGPTAKRNKLYILPIGEFNEIENNLIRTTAEYIKCFFMLDVEISEPISSKIIPKKFKRNNYGVEQLNTKYIMNSILHPNIPSDAICYISITNKDLYPDENWNFVFGQASLNGRTGVSSFCRFFYNKLDSANYKECLERSIKTTTHEMCHMFSLKHCVIHQCLVNGCNSLQEADSKPLWLCPECLAKLQWSIKFDLIQRYDSLINFTYKYGFEKEKVFYMKSKNIMIN